MPRLLDCLLTYLEDYDRDMVPIDGKVSASVFNNLGMSEKEFNEFLSFCISYTAGVKAWKPKQKTALFIEGFIMALYMVGRTYNLDYTDFRKC
jgi:hypothetical protein